MTKSFVEKIVVQRDRKVISCYQRGDRIEIIEAFFGITKSRIYQILSLYKIPKVRRKKDLSPETK